MLEPQDNASAEPADEIEMLAAEAFARLESGGEPALDAFLAVHPERSLEIRQALEAVAYFDAAVGDTTQVAVDPVALLSVKASTGLARGTQVGDFIVLDEIGRGGMGIVYRARQRRLKRDVALKILPPEFGASSERVQRFVREARICARISHPGVVTVYDAGQAGGICYLAMELVEGETLSRVFDQGLLTIMWGVEIGKQVADALAAAHATELLHRDVKPGNIMLAGATVKLMDFGLALDRSRDEATLTRSGVVLGTPAYMAPEQLGRGASQLDGRADIYSLGVVLYEGLTGQLPYPSEVTAAILRDIRDRPPLPPLRRGSRLPRDLETILMRCLEKRPESRYQSAADLRDDLDRFARGEPIQARPIPLVVRGYRWVESHPVRATAAVGVLSVLLVSTYFLSTLESKTAIAEYEQRLHDADLMRVHWERADKEARRTIEQQGLDLLAIRGELARLSAADPDVDHSVWIAAGRALGRAEAYLEAGMLEEAAAELQASAAILPADQDLTGQVALVREAIEIERERILESAAQAFAASQEEIARAAALSAREPVAPHAPDPEASARVGAAIAQARKLADARDFTAALAVLDSNLLPASAETSSEELHRLRAIFGGAQRFMEAARGGLREMAGGSIEFVGHSGGEFRGDLGELTLDEGEGAFWLLLADGGRVKVQLRSVDGESLQRWASARASAIDRVAFFFAEGQFEKAAAIAEEVARQTPTDAIVEAALGEMERWRGRAFAESFPHAEIKLRSSGEMTLVWDFADGHLPPAFAASTRAAVTEGRLCGDELACHVPLSLRADASIELRAAADARIGVLMGSTPLHVGLKADVPLEIQRRAGTLMGQGQSVPADDQRLTIAHARSGAGSLCLDRLQISFTPDESWQLSMKGPRQSLAAWDWRLPATAVWRGGAIKGDLQNAGVRAMIFESELFVPAPPPRGPEGERPPPMRQRPVGRQQLVAAGAVEFQTGRGMRMDLEYRFDGARRPRQAQIRFLGAREQVLAELPLEEITPGTWRRLTFFSNSFDWKPGEATVRMIELRIIDEAEPFSFALMSMQLSALEDGAR